MTVTSSQLSLFIHNIIFFFLYSRMLRCSVASVTSRMISMSLADLGRGGGPVKNFKAE